MKKYLILAATSVLALSSCYYDSNYGSGGYGGDSSYGSSYGDGGGFSSSVFISTGSPRWRYDPYRYSYYDVYRNAYYDPYLYGYYPVGYMPSVVHGIPHPHGYSRNYCPPPSNIKMRQLSRYDDRISNYSSANYVWARKAGSSGQSRWLDANARTQLNNRALGNYSNNSAPSRNRYDENRQSPSWFGTPSMRSAPTPAPSIQSNRMAPQQQYFSPTGRNSYRSQQYDSAAPQARMRGYDNSNNENVFINRSQPRVQQPRVQQIPTPRDIMNHSSRANAAPSPRAGRGDMNYKSKRAAADDADEQLRKRIQGR